MSHTPEAPHVLDEPRPDTPDGVPGTSAAQPPTVPVARPPAAVAHWGAVAAILIGEVLDLLESLVTTVAGPSILRDLGGSESALQWLSAIYTLGLAGGLLIGGRLGDRYGRRRLFLIGMAGFVATSVIAACSTGIDMLLAARLAQGMLGALMLPQSFGLIRDVVPRDMIGKAFGIFGVTLALSAIAGPIVAGLLVDANILGLGWRAIFAINIPLGVIGLIVGRSRLPESSADRTIRIDLVGCVLAVLALVALVFPLVEGRDLGWPLWCFGMLAASVVLLAIFVRQQRTRAASGRDVLVVPSLFGKKVFLGALAISLAFFTAFTSAAFILAVVLQLGMGLSPTESAVATLPMAAGMVLGMKASDRIARGRRQLLMGYFVAAVGLILLVVTLAVGPANAWLLAPGLLIVGVGVGSAMGPIFDVLTASLDEHEVGSASGLLNTVQQIGMAIGVAALGSILFAVIADRPDIEGYLDGAAAAYAIAAVLMVVAAVLTAVLIPADAADANADNGGTPAEAA